MDGDLLVSPGECTSILDGGIGIGSDPVGSAPCDLIEGIGIGIGIGSTVEPLELGLEFEGTSKGFSFPSRDGADGETGLELLLRVRGNVLLLS